MQDTGLKRNTIDKYYTKNSIVLDCINNFKNNVQLLANDIIIEPSAGNGAFINEIKNISNNLGITYKFYDIEPENDGIIKQDFLNLDIKYNNKNIHIIGNPPFGRQSSIAIKFIKKCCEFANSISFILPRSFKKDSMKKYFTDYYHLIFEKDLDNNAFIVNNIEYDVPCIFQIWILKNYKRELPIKEEPNFFKFVKKNETPDISVRRVGVYAGNISKDIIDKSIESHYFIKFINNKTIDFNINCLKEIKFEKNNTVGPKSISKQEIILEFNKYIIN